MDIFGNDKEWEESSGVISKSTGWKKVDFVHAATTTTHGMSTIPQFQLLTNHPSVVPSDFMPTAHPSYLSTRAHCIVTLVYSFSTISGLIMWQDKFRYLLCILSSLSWVSTCYIFNDFVDESLLLANVKLY